MKLLPSTVSTVHRHLARVGMPVALAASLVLSLATTTWAGPKPTPRPPFLPPYDAITSVDATAKTLVVGHVNSNDKTSKTYKLIPTTEIQVNGEKAPVTSLQAGMKVSVTPAMDETIAERVVASPAPTPPPATPSKTH